MSDILITSEGQLEKLSLGTLFTDTDGDTWLLASISERKMVSPETAHMDWSYVLKHFGPLTLRWSPDEDLLRVQPSHREIESAISKALYGSDHAIDVAVDSILALLAKQPTVEEIVSQTRRTDWLSQAIWDIAYERMTHTERGWTPEHDAKHGVQHLIGLVLDRLQIGGRGSGIYRTDRGQLVKAASLLVAAVDLLDTEADHG